MPWSLRVSEEKIEKKEEEKQQSRAGPGPRTVSDLYVLHKDRVLELRIYPSGKAFAWPAGGLGFNPPVQWVGSAVD